MYRIESLLSARHFLVPQTVGDRLYFLSNLSGRMSLYAMDTGGSVPEPLLPSHIALQNPDLMMGGSFLVLPAIGQILVMIDHDGDEVYKPHLVPIAGGHPEPLFSEILEPYRANLSSTDEEAGVVYLVCGAIAEPKMTAFKLDLLGKTMLELGSSPHGCHVMGHNRDHTQVLLLETYQIGDHVLRLWEQASGQTRLLYGTPLDARTPGDAPPRNGIGHSHILEDGEGLLCTTVLFSDAGGLAYLPLQPPHDLEVVKIEGIRHSGRGELVDLEHLQGQRYLIHYNMDGCSWLYEARYDHARRTMHIVANLCGEGTLSDGVLKGGTLDRGRNRFACTWTSATTPTQLVSIEGPAWSEVRVHTRERVLGIPSSLLSPGEDASFTSHDGLEISARLYHPSSELGFEGPRPLVYYIHGGPQSQERPDFGWFSMPLIQMLTLKGFAVFVPNVRGSTGYGFDYMQRVARDWGGQDRLDHVFAMTEVLPQDPRVDTARAGVMGRSYGGYMTLTLAGRHPDLWSGAVDMFGPYDLLGFVDRVPEAWKPSLRFLVGDPETEQEMLIERSPKSYLSELRCPMLVIQGKNDPRVLEEESRELVEFLRERGQSVDYLCFEDEGHDMVKHVNRVRCYDTIIAFFERTLMRGEGG